MNNIKIFFHRKMKKKKMKKQNLKNLNFGKIEKAPPLREAPCLADIQTDWRLVLVDADDDAGADGTAALTDSEAEAVLDGDGGNQLNVHVDVVAGHAHLNALGQEMTPVTSVVRK